MSGSSPPDDRNARRDRLIRLARGGDRAAASELHHLAARTDDPDAIRAAAAALVAAGDWQLEHGVHQLTVGDTGWQSQRQRFGCLPDAGLAVVVVGSSTETEGERRAAAEQGQPDLAARAADQALETLLSTETLVAICGQPPDVRLRGLEARVATAAHEATGVEVTPRRGERQRRGWLPNRHRRRRRAGRRRVVRGQVAIAAVSFDAGSLAIATLGGCSVHRLRRVPLLERLLPLVLDPEPHDASGDDQGDSPPPPVDVDEAAHVGESVETRLVDIDTGELVMLVGPDYDRVARVLSPGALLAADEPLDARARRLVRTWSRVASPSVQREATHEMGALLVRLAVTTS